MNTLLGLAKKLHNTLAVYNGAGHAMGWKTDKVDRLLDESKRVIEASENLQPAQRKPLTNEQFQAICNRLSRQGGWDGDGWDLALKEAIEAAHNIKENT